MPKTTAQQNTETKQQARPQSFTGTVVSTKMKDTAVVLVECYVRHHKYGKYQNRRSKIMAHDAGNTKKVGDKVTIVACKPISKNKAFTIAA